MKKRIFSIFLGLIVCFILVLPNFFDANSNISETNAIVSEADINFIQDIVSVNINEMGSDLRSDAVEKQNPYYSKTNEMLPGYSIVPTSNNDNEIRGEIYSIKPFSLSQSTSVFVWIYLPDSPYTNFYTLKVSFLDENNNSINWVLDFDKLSNLVGESYTYNYGWKLFEFVFDDAELDGADSDTEYTKMKIEYFLEYYDEVSDMLQKKTNGRLSFYHVYLGSKTLNKTSVLLQLSYVNYKVKASFKEEFNSLCYMDKYVVKEVKDIFEYIYVGKFNLLLSGSQNNIFTWSFYFKNNKGKTDVVPGQPFEMNVKGENTLRIILEEKRDDKDREIINTYVSVNCSDYIFGFFSKSEYSIYEEDTLIINFKIKDTFDLIGDINFSTSDEEILKINSFYFDNSTNSYVVNVTAVKKGRANIIATATGLRDNLINGEFSTSSEFSVRKRPVKFFTPGTWLGLGIIYGSAILVFGTFTFINFKRAKKKIKENEEENSKKENS